jgi:hypothetical protein
LHPELKPKETNRYQGRDMQYHTNTTGPDKNGFLQGLRKALSVAEENGTNEVLIATHTLSNIKGVIQDVLGEAFIKKFKRDKVAKAGQVVVYFETERTKSRFSKGVILAPFVSLKLLNTLTSDYRTSDIVYVPWADTEFNEYVQSNPNSVPI